MTLTAERVAVNTANQRAVRLVSPGPQLVAAPRPSDTARSLTRIGAPFLRKLLVLIDAIAVAVAWGLAFAVPGIGTSVHAPTLLRPVTEVLLVVTATLAVIGVQRLYLARVCAVRAVEVARLARAAMVSIAVAYLSSRLLDISVPGWRLVVGGALSFVALASCRSLYAGWLKSARTGGRFGRPMVIVGSNDEGFELYRLLHTHPEIGFRISGVVGRADELRGWGDDVRWLGDVSSTVGAVKHEGATGVIVAASAVPPEELNRLTRELAAAGVHVHLSSGLRGIAHRRLRSLPLAYEPLFYLEPITLSPWQFTAKRMLDLVLATAVLILTAPVLVLAAIAVKLQDRGPVLFRQERVGRNGKPFRVLKLRTMVPDADALTADVQAQNERTGGPLFKMTGDPRRTRVGRWLEAASIDELPQLFNVLRGEMSLVGPRPALPSEIEQFDDELLERLSVPPGVTGLWQAEARDNPEFHAYRRLDLFYVENWSVTLDFTVLLATVRSLIVRLLRHNAGAEAAACPRVMS